MSLKPISLDDWRVEVVEPDKINIRLYLSSPKSVSYLRNYKDLLTFEVLEPGLFIGVESGKSIGEDEEAIAAVFLPQ